MTLDIGMLGYRFMGKAHANALARLPMFFPDAPTVKRDVLIGRDEDALREAASTLGFERVTTDWREVIDEVDAFYNLGPNHVHTDPSIEALEGGTPVLCEKPLAPTLGEARAMADAAADTSVTAGVAFNYRFVPAIRYAKALIDDGEIGDIRHFRGRYLQEWLVDPSAPWSWRNDEELAGSGALGDLGTHTIDLARFLVGERAGEIERVSGHCHTFVTERPTGNGETRSVTVDDAFSTQLAFENGAMGTIEASRVATGHANDHTVEIEGTDGALRFSLERLNELEVHHGDSRGFETVSVTGPDDPFGDHWWPPGHVLGWEHTFVHENDAFLRAVRDGSDYEPNFQDGLVIQRILDAVQRSDERGTWVTVG